MEQAMNATDRMEIEVKRDMRQREIGYFVMRLLDELRDEVRVYPKTPQGEMPDHDVTFNSDAAKVLADAFQREPDMIARILPEGFAVVDIAILHSLMKMLSGAIPMPVSPFTPSLGPVDGQTMTDYALRVSADKLCGLSEHARRQRDEAERR